MKVLFLKERKDEKLVEILTKLGVEIKEVENNVEAFIKEWQANKDVKVIFDEYFISGCSSQVEMVCKGLEITQTPRNFIDDNFSQNQINNLTFGEVEYIKGFAGGIKWECPKDLSLKILETLA